MDKLLNTVGIQLPPSGECVDCKALDSQAVQVKVFNRNTCISCIKRDVVLANYLFPILMKRAEKSYLDEVEDLSDDADEAAQKEHASAIESANTNVRADVERELKDAVSNRWRKFGSEIKGPGQARITFAGSPGDTAQLTAVKFSLRAFDAPELDRIFALIDAGGFSFADEKCQVILLDPELGLPAVVTDILLARTLCCPGTNNISFKYNYRTSCRLHSYGYDGTEKKGGATIPTSLVPVELKEVPVEVVRLQPPRHFEVDRETEAPEVTAFLKTHGAPRASTDSKTEQLIVKRLVDLGKKGSDIKFVPTATLEALKGLSMLQAAAAIAKMPLKDLYNNPQNSEKKQQPKKDKKKEKGQETPKKTETPKKKPQEKKSYSEVASGPNTPRTGKKSPPESPRKSGNDAIIGALSARLGNHFFDLEYARQFWKGGKFQFPKNFDMDYFKNRVIKDNRKAKKAPKSDF